MDNDLAICQAIQKGLQDDVTEICCMTSPAEALVSYLEENYCLIILDAQFSDMDSIEMLRIMRRSKHTPILLLTNPLSSEEIVEFLHAGADTYIEKPTNIEVCAAQANVLIQRYIDADIDHNQHKPIIHGSELIISPRYRQVIVDGKSLELTRKEFDLLHCFAKHPGQVLSREQLYDYIWSDEPAVAVDEAVKSLIRKLRKKLASVKNSIFKTRGESDTGLSRPIDPL